MKSLKTKKKQNYEKDYNKIMNGYQLSAPIQFAPQWINPNDYFVKFSLYEETPNSITSTNTSITAIF